MTTLEEDPQINALVRASGHTRDDAVRILNELNKIGWSVRPVTGLLASIPSHRLPSGALAEWEGDDGWEGDDWEGMEQAWADRDRE